ncbi:hypothetical protein PIB30_098222, partial [Stylosanthes scabra]|nr:hypothetical protein [Stylosanthes scabra]
MKKGSLQSKKQNLKAKQRKTPTHMRGRARICMLLEDLSTPWLPFATHRRGGARIC